MKGNLCKDRRLRLVYSTATRGIFQNVLGFRETSPKALCACRKPILCDISLMLQRNEDQAQRFKRCYSDPAIVKISEKPASFSRRGIRMIGYANVVRNAAYLFLLAVAALVALAQEESVSQRFPKIKCAELKKLIDSKAADILVVCNDPQESFEEGHIPGAISFPWVTVLKPPIALPRNKALILYCSCSHEEDSSDMAAKLAGFGYHDIKVLEGGFIKWVQLKYPVQK